MKKILIVKIVIALFAFNLYAQEDLNLIKQKYESLEKEYETLKNDRDNILLQAKSLLEFKSQLAKKEAEVIKLTTFFEKLKDDKINLSDKIAALESHIKDLNNLDMEKIEQIDALKKHIENMEIEYKIVNETKKKLKISDTKNRMLGKQVLDLKKKIGKIEGQKIEAKASSQAYKRQIKDLRAQHRKELSLNKKLESKLEQIPKKFAEVARENRMLIKETALMHYNLGVFYLENEEHRRAVAEFEKTLELHPDDAYAHFNLGYIYSEYLVERAAAVKHFKKYLRLTKNDDEDVDWVKKYIITWQTWEGKKPLK